MIGTRLTRPNSQIVMAESVWWLAYARAASNIGKERPPG
jgi:hypothetical protein